MAHNLRPGRLVLGLPGRRWLAHMLLGTPEREVGELQDFVHRHADGRTAAAVHLVTELVERHSVVTQHAGPPRDQTYHLIAPAPGGTRLELASRWPARASKSGGKNTAADVAGRLQMMQHRGV